MIDVTHFHEGGSWAFESLNIPGFAGGGSTFDKSVEASEHAYRQHLSRTNERPVSMEEARGQLRHVRGMSTVAWLGHERWQRQLHLLTHTT